MPTLFSRIPIRLKIISSFSIILLFFATLNFIYYPKIHEKQALDYIKSHLQNMAETVALSTGISLENMDFSSLGLTIDWAKKDSGLVYLGIFDHENDVVGIFNPNSLKLNIPELMNRKGHFELDGSLYTVVPIKHKNKDLGKTIVGLSLNELNAGILDNKVMTLNISLGILLLGILISIFISNRITKPLSRLTKATRELGQGNYSVNINVKSSDEVGMLASSFQVMVEKLNQAMTENKRSNKLLEGIVADLTEMGTTLSAEKDLGNLLQLIISKAQTLAHADAGTLYMVVGGKLQFSIIYNKTLNTKLEARRGDKIPFPPVDIIETNLSGYVALNKKSLNIADIYSYDKFDLKGPKIYDEISGYRSQSMLTIPLLNLDDKTVGVLQLINSKDPKTGEIVPFPHSAEKLVQSLASQAAVAITNLMLNDKTKDLLKEVTDIKNYNEGILESMSNGVIALDSRNRIIKCNSASLDILGLESEELIGYPMLECFSDKSGGLMENVQNVLESGKPKILHDREILNKYGHSISANLTISLLVDIKNEQVDTLVVLEDITMEKRIRGTLGRFMTKEVADKLLEDEEVHLGGQIQEAAVLFSDIRNFTAISESLHPKQTVEMLNDYFDIMVEIVFDNGGTLDKFIGDSLLAVFGVPFKGPNDSKNAVYTAMEMINNLRNFNQKRNKSNKIPINIGIGINTSEVLAGNIGCLKRMDYTIIGDGVNLASRLESANKFFGTQIIISQNTFSIIKNDFLCREIDLIKLKGKNIAISIYEVLNFNGSEPPPQKIETLKIFQEGLNYYRERKWEKGIKKFNKILSLYPDDKVSQIYVDRSKNMINHPPDKNWNAVWVMDSK